MKLNTLYALIAAAAGFAGLIGCGPTPVVHDTQPDTVHTDVDVHPDPSVDRVRPAPGTGVDVEVGGGKGVDVQVNPPANEPNRNP